MLTRRSLIAALLTSGLAAAAPNRTPPPKTLRIAVLNQSSTILDPTIIPAVQKQIDEHFSPIWGYSANLYSAQSSAVVPRNDYTCTVLDYTDVSGDTAYHRVDDTGRPCARVYALTAAHNREELSVVISHEVLEMIGNPWGYNSVLYDAGNGTGALYSYELCDPVQGTTYQIDGVSVSDFVTPRYFQKGSNSPYDYLGVLKSPFTTAPSGIQRPKLINWNS